jgi:putative transposase
MSWKKYTAEQVIAKLHEAEVLQSQGKSVGETVRQLGISDMTYYKWRKEYGGLRVDQAKRPKGLERENQQIRKVVAEHTVDIRILVVSFFYSPTQPDLIWGFFVDLEVLLKDSSRSLISR